jgi:CubicO group peptidase (beta-lactamase class C family)
VIARKALPVTIALVILAACGPTPTQDSVLAGTPQSTLVPATDTLSPTGVSMTPTVAPTPATLTTGGTVQGWAVLAQKDDYDDVDMADLPVDYAGVTQMQQVLEDFGWQPDHIRELREFDRETLQEGMDWLAESADQDDVVLLYVAAHGMYLKRVLAWDDFFADEWEDIPSHRRLLVIDSCQAANYTGVLSDDPAPYLSIAAVAGDEYGWSGLEEEGLPIIGGVFTHYFARALDDPGADADGNGLISVQEAVWMAEGQQRAYMHDVVFAVPEFLESYHESGFFPDRDPDFPHVVVDDAIGAPLYLVLDVYEAAVGSWGAPEGSAPEQTDDGWQTTRLDQVGMDRAKIDQAVALIQDNTYQNVHAILIVKDGKLAFETYFGGYTWDYNGDQYRGAHVGFDRDTLHNLASVTKSFTSALIGMAIDQGLIRGVDERVCGFFPAYAGLCDEKKEQITLEHLLTMTSGLEWNEMELSYSNTDNDLVQLFIVPDPVEYILAKPIVGEPGTDWYYSGGNTNLLGEVIREATGQRMDDFAAEYLFAPLGIADYEWDHINPDVIHASGNLKLRPRDMAKLGYLYLNGGVWNGERVISEEWIEASTKEYASTPGGGGYGYQWWRKTYRSEDASVDAFCANGWGGQRITVFPSLDMVVVFTGGNYVGQEPVDEIIARYILPAVH